MALITTTLGDRDDATLIKSTGRIDNETETTTWVEYCLPACHGAAHLTGMGSAPGVFCDRHIHRSVNMELKIGVAGIGSAGSF